MKEQLFTSWKDILVVKTLKWRSDDLVSISGSALGFLSDFEQTTLSVLCFSMHPSP